MPTSTSRLSYPDCEDFLSAALDDELGARLPFLTRSMATMFRIRLNTFRKICRADNAEIYPEKDHPLHGRCEFDPLSISIEGPDANDEYWIYARRRRLNMGEVEPLSTVPGEYDDDDAMENNDNAA